MEWYYILIIALGALIFLLFALALLAYKIAFGARCDKNPLLKYYDPKNLNTESISVKSGNTKLNGFVYTCPAAENNGKVIVFCHGLGAGHAAYTTEIEYFCKNGFTVVALDSAGCDLSEGKTIRGMYSGVKTAKAALRFAKSAFAGSKIYLVGHSWGAYSALCASAERAVDGVVAISAPLTPAKTLYCGARGIISAPLAFVLRPFWRVIDFLKFGFNGNKNSAFLAEKSGIPTLLVHGDNDTIVPFNNSAYAYANGENIEKYLAKGKSHNPYASPAAQALLIELNAKLLSARKMSEEERKYFDNFDFAAAVEEDAEVMQKIKDFIIEN